MMNTIYDENNTWTACYSLVVVLMVNSYIDMQYLLYISFELIFSVGYTG